MDYSGVRRGPRMGTLHLSVGKDFAPSATSSAIPAPEKTFNFEDGFNKTAGRHSSLGLLRAEDLNANNTNNLEAKSFFNFEDEDKENLENSEVDTPHPKSLPSMYLKPMENLENSEICRLKGVPSMYLKATENAADISVAGNGTLENMDWKTLLNSDSFRHFQRSLPESRENVEESFARGTVSARSTSIGGDRPKENTVDERFSDYSTIATSNASSSYSYQSSNQGARENVNVGKRNPFDDDDRQDGFVAEVDLGQFEAITDPLAFINEEEKRFEKENQFVAPETITEKQGDDEKSDVTSVLSKSEYFLMSTSTVGSLGKDDRQERPNFGLKTVRSPKRTPCRIILENNEVSKKRDDDLKEEDVNQFLPSFMEATTVEFTEPPKEVSTRSDYKLKQRPASRIPVTSDSQFKAPLPIKVAKSKSTSIRHSSPIKLPEKASRALSIPNPVAVPTPVTREPINPNTFPITSDRNSVLWFGVLAGNSEDKVVTLKNEWKSEVSLSLMIRGSSNFKLSESGTDRIAISIPGQSQKSFFVTFVPSEADINIWKAAKLVIKPKVLIGGKALKNTITLYGKCGKSQVRFPDLFGAPKRYGTNAETFTISLGELPNDICKVSRFTVENVGSSTAFVNIESFSDENLTSVISYDAIRLEPNSFILRPKSVKEITVRIDPALIEMDPETSSLIGSIFCLIGDESTLGLLSQCISKSGKSPCLAGTPLNLGNIIEKFQKSSDFLSKQDQVQVLISGTERNLRDIQDEMVVKCINLYGRKSSLGEFQALDVEETLSQTRFNCTADFAATFSVPYSNKGGCATIPEEVVSQGPPRENSKRNKRGVFYMPVDTLIFPQISVNGLTVMKLKVVNNLKSESTIVNVSNVNPPFSIHQKRWEIKKNNFLNLPFTCAPKSEGRHETKVKLTSDDGSFVLIATLKATAK